MKHWNVADQLAIRNLYAAYTYAFDDHDADAFVDCFTEDAEIEVTGFAVVRDMVAAGQAPYVNSQGRVVGAERIRTLVGIISSLTLHLSGNFLIKRLDGDSCDAQASFAVFAEDGVVEHYGRYLDKLLRCSDGCWRFAERRDICRYERKR